MSGPFAGTLRERITIEQLSQERNAMGLSEGVWTVLASCRAAIVLEGAGSESEGMALSVMPRFRVTVRARPELAVDQRVQWDGRTLMVRQVNADPKLKDRVTLRCEEVRS
jgi:head-tail adaptor